MASSPTVLSSPQAGTRWVTSQTSLKGGKTCVQWPGGARDHAEDCAKHPTRKFPKVLASWLLGQGINSRSLDLMCGKVKQEGDKCDKNSSRTAVLHVQNRREHGCRC